MAIDDETLSCSECGLSPWENHCCTCEPCVVKKLARVGKRIADLEAEAVLGKATVLAARMDKARRDASHAVLMQALADVARWCVMPDGWAKEVVKKADAAALNVQPEDLVVAGVHKCNKPK